MAFVGSNWGRRVLLTGLAPSASLSGFVALVDLSNIPTEAIDAGTNSALNNGGDLRFSTDDAGVNQLPLEVVSYVTNATASLRRCQLWIRFPSYASGTREVYMFYKKTGETQPAVGAAFGRNAAWVDYEYNFHLDSSNKLIDSTGNHSLTESGFVSSITGQIEGGVTSSGSAANKLSLSAYTGPSGSTARTHKLWGKTAAVSDRSILEYGTDATGKRYTIRFDDTSVAGSFRTEIQGSFAYTNNSFNDGLWHCFVSKVDGTTSFPACYSAVVDGVNQTLTTGASQSINTVPLGNVGFDANIKSFFIPSDQDEQSLRLFHTTDAQDASECLNESDPSTFWATGTPETPSSGISIAATLGTIEYNSNDTVIGLAGVVDVTATLGAINYSSNDAVIQVSGDVNVIATLGAINYASNDTAISLFGNVDVTATLGTIDYNSNDTSVSLLGGINVSATLGAIDYVSSDTTITLQGQVALITTLGTISYDSNNVIVQVGAGQVIGNVTAGFADNLYSVGFKPSEITVNFKT